MAETKALRVLHLSDLHVGMSSQYLLWPNVKEVLFEDLTALARSVGQWDAVLFSGDFAQKGLDSEFDEVIVRLRDLWTLFEELGFQPPLICIPGNHDIRRPDSKEPAIKVLHRWFDDRDIWEDFFADINDPYRRAVGVALSGYDRFIQALSQTTIPLASCDTGLLPGDQLVEIHSGDVSLGVMGLNSTWLQLTGNGYKGKLAVDLRQVHALRPDLGAWCNSNQFNVVTTHHPLDWFHPDSLDSWNSEIDPPGRFDLHLFGHMHEPFSQTLGVSGARSRHSMQSPSLFGMDTLGDNKTQRIHGYTLLSFESADGCRSIRVWPRRLQAHRSGKHRFIADTDFILEDDKFFTIGLDAQPPKANVQIAPQVSQLLGASVGQNRDILRPIKYHLLTSPAHRRVRHAEQRQCREALSAERAVWLTAEWGLGGDEFLASVLASGLPLPRIFRLDASDYLEKDAFSAEVGRKLGCNFAELCDAFEDEPSVLILDDIPTAIDAKAGDAPIETDLEALVVLLRDACPRLRIVLRSLRKPQGNDLVDLNLLPLDEADVKTYVADHDRGGPRFTTIETIAILHRRSDGYPIRLEECLKELMVGSLDELVTSEDEYGVGREQSDAPPMLKRAIGDLVAAEDKVTKRMFSLLQALMVFPQGAQLGRIKRFNGVHPFHSGDALKLMDNALLTVSETPEVGGAETHPPQSVLLVPRPIRDYLRTLVNDDELDSLNMKAASLLFGSEWMTGSKHWPPHLDYSSSKCSNADITNASALLVRLFKRHRNDPEGRQAKAIVTTASAFASSLYDGAHYSSLANFCRDFIPLLDVNDYEEKRANIVRLQAYAARMLSDKDRAIALLNEVIDFPFSNVARQNVLVEMALCHKDEDPQASLQYASRAFKMDRHSSSGSQAQAIVLELAPRGAERTRKLTLLEKAARKRGHFVVSNNIALTLASETTDDHDASSLLSGVLNSPKGSASFYNRGRAVLEVVQRKIKKNAPVSDQELSQLVACYQFLLNERVPWMFNACHKALWQIFTERYDWQNLLALFRYSSVIWQLRGEEHREFDHLRELRDVLASTPVSLIRQSKASHYYYSSIARQEDLKSVTGT